MSNDKGDRNVIEIWRQECVDLRRENATLKAQIEAMQELLRDIRMMFDNVRIDFSNGVDYNGIDEGVVRSQGYMQKLDARIDAALARPEAEGEKNHE